MEGISTLPIQGKIMARSSSRVTRRIIRGQSGTKTVATGNGAVKKRLTVRQPSRKAYVDGNILVFTLAANVSVSGGNLVIEDTGISVRDDVIFI